MRPRVISCDNDLVGISVLEALHDRALESARARLDIIRVAAWSAVLHSVPDFISREHGPGVNALAAKSEVGTWSRARSPMRRKRQLPRTRATYAPAPTAAAAARSSRDCVLA